MPDGASSEDLRNDKALRTYIAANAKSWYEYVEGEARGRSIGNGDIHMVVGFDKVTSWGIATFARNVENQVRFEFNSVCDATTVGVYAWDCVGCGSGRVGPRKEEMRGLILESDTGPLQNQCVFVRTLNFTLSGRIWDALAVCQVRSNHLKDGNPESMPPNSPSGSLPRSQPDSTSYSNPNPEVNFQVTQLCQSVSR